MKQQPEALRLADALEDDLTGYDGLSIPGFCQNIANEAAAELRRLHAENEAAHCVGIQQERDLMAVEAQRDELLEALQMYLVDASEPECAIWRHIQQKARAAIAKATGEPNV